MPTKPQPPDPSAFPFAVEPTPTAPVPDYRAEAEKESFLADASDRTKTKRAVGQALRSLLWFVTVLGGVLVLIRFLHLVLPPEAQWLDEKRIATIDGLLKLLTSGAIGSFIGRYFTKLNE
jgi:hypothetical protein